MSSIKPDYLLTPEEEQTVIANEIERMKNYTVWKMANLAYSEAHILETLHTTDFESQIDKAVLLKKANANKEYYLWQEQQREKEKEEALKRAEEIKSKWTATAMFHLIKGTSENTYGKKLLLNDQTLPLLKTICFFLSRDARFETELSYDLKKGLLLRGDAGLGKTYLVKCAGNNELNPVLILSMLEITHEIKAEGEYKIEMGKDKILYLDDVGTEEPVVNHYGTKITFFKNFIEGYYLNRRPFQNLMFSTNNSFQEMEEKYGVRVRSRIRDMFNIINVTGEDLRGK